MCLPFTSLHFTSLSMMTYDLEALMVPPTSRLLLLLHLLGPHLIFYLSPLLFSPSSFLLPPFSFLPPLPSLVPSIPPSLLFHPLLLHFPRHGYLLLNLSRHDMTRQAAFIRNPDYSGDTAGPEIVTLGHNPYRPNVVSAPHCAVVHIFISVECFWSSSIIRPRTFCYVWLRSERAIQSVLTLCVASVHLPNKYTWHISPITLLIDSSIHPFIRSSHPLLIHPV